MKKKTIFPWALCLILPVPLLAVIAFLQTIARMVANDNPTVVIVINMVSIIVGFASVVMLVLLPLWLILLIKAVNDNKSQIVTQDSQPQQVSNDNPASGQTNDSQNTNQLS